MIGDYEPPKYRPNPLLLALAALITAATLVMLAITSQPGADQPPVSCDYIEEC